jgi:glycopeptide antibiotics resistance protein
MLDNVIVFIPFGLLLSASLKQTSFRQKLALIFLFSFSAEILQFVFAIGTTDITDVITNTFGGLLGLALYALGDRHIESKTMDWVSSAIVTSLLVTIVLLRVLVFRVRY